MKKFKIDVSFIKYDTREDNDSVKKKKNQVKLVATTLFNISWVCS